ncbi:MAG: hypothetical protein Kow0070_19920 [Anaerolineales bacterium]
MGSTSITTDSTGAKVSELRYAPWGEIRYSWTSGQTTTPAYTLPSYTFTGQYSYLDDPSTAGVTEGFGLMFYNARWYDPALGRFAQADTIVPLQSQGVQAWDRYAYVNNGPTRFTDPIGHKACDGAGVNGGCDQSGIPGTLGQLKSTLKSFGVKIRGNWSLNNLYAVYLGVIKVADKLASSRGGNEISAAAFRAVFDKGINFVWDPHCNGCRAGTIYEQNKKGAWVDTGKECGSNYTSPGCVPSGGFTAGATITFASMSGQRFNDLDRMAKNVVHEIGHVYYHSVLDAPDLGSSFSRDALRPNEPAGRLDWQQHPGADGGELFADTFIAWTYNAWNTNPQFALAVNNAQSAMDAFVPKP